MTQKKQKRVSAEDALEWQEKNCAEVFPSDKAWICRTSDSEEDCYFGKTPLKALQKAIRSEGK